MNYRHSPIQQRGAILLIVLVMLVMITVFVVSMIRFSNASMRVVGNMQAQQGAEQAAEQVIEDVITKFSDVPNNAGDWPTGTASVTKTVNSYTVVVTRPTCYYTEKSSGYSELDPLAPDDTYWDIPVTATDNLTSAQVEVHQGVKTRMLSGSCP